MTTDSIKVTSEEIAHYRSQLTGNLEALAALKVIDDDCEGYLEDAIPLLLMRETGTQPDRSISDWLRKCRQFICTEDVRKALESGIIAPAIEPISIGAGIPPGTATAIAILAFKLGMKKVCADYDK